MIVGFAGSGNMAGAMARGWASVKRGPDEMLFSDSGSGRAQALADELGEVRVESLEELADRSDVVVLAVKPNALAEAAPAIAGRVDGVISVLGATPLASLREALGETPVLRTMPNLAVEVHRGVICHTAAEPALGPALELLGALGTTVELEEDRLDAATAVMGCAPAYLARAVEALIEAGVEAGLDPELSDMLVREAAAGTGEHLLSREPREMQDAIASPGGSTEAGLEALEEAGGPDAFRAAVSASLERMAGVR
jgi:pyrroline-5-carboxylate reductase